MILDTDRELRAIRRIRWVQQIVESREGQAPYWLGRLLKWGENLPPGCLESMWEHSEVGVLSDETGLPRWLVFMDASGNLRQGTI